MLKFVVIGDTSVGKPSLLVRFTDQRFLTNPDTTVSTCSSMSLATLGFMKLGVEPGSILVYVPDEDKTFKLRCACSISTSTVNFYGPVVVSLLIALQAETQQDSTTSAQSRTSWRAHRLRRNLTRVLPAGRRMGQRRPHTGRPEPPHSEQGRLSSRRRGERARRRTLSGGFQYRRKIGSDWPIRLA